MSLVHLVCAQCHGRIEPVAWAAVPELAPRFCKPECALNYRRDERLKLKQEDAVCASA